MRSLVLIFISLFSFSSQAKMCGGLDAVANWIQKGRELHSSSFKKGSKALESEWSSWQMGITRELEASSAQKDTAAIVKSIKRKLDSDALELEKQLGQTQKLSQSAQELESRISKLFVTDSKALKSIQEVKTSNPKIYEQFLEWQKTIATDGIEGMRRIPGYNDEYLKQLGCRSSRLTQKYRVMYNVDPSGKINVLSIDPHKFMK